MRDSLMTSDDKTINTIYTELKNAEFGEVLEITPRGEIVPAFSEDAPEVEFIPDATDQYHDLRIGNTTYGKTPTNWEALTGLTGQWGYNGAILHPSEVMSHGIAELLYERATEAEGRFFVTQVVVETYDTDEDGELEVNDVGWAILTWDTGSTPVTA